MSTPLRRYHPTAEWEVVGHAMQSPAPDGSVAYYQDSLSPTVGVQVALFDDQIARALCQFHVAQVVRQGLQIVDGPYIQLLEDQGVVPAGWVMLRAVVWVDEFDELVPDSPSAYDDTELTGVVQP